MKMDVLVSEVMAKDVKTVFPEDTIEKAARIMNDENISSVVVTKGKFVVGILTAKDVVYKHVAGGVGRFVKDIMTKELVSIGPEKTIGDAARLMAKHEIERLPVFSKDRLVGILTNNDILRIEPALFEVLLERMKIGGRAKQPVEMDMVACEVCGNYSDDAEEINGVYTCSDCKG